MISKHRKRHARAYAAGARDACEVVKETLSQRLPAETRADLGKLIDGVKNSQFPMPEPPGKEKAA